MRRRRRKAGQDRKTTRNRKLLLVIVVEFGGIYRDPQSNRTISFPSPIHYLTIRYPLDYTPITAIPRHLVELNAFQATDSVAGIPESERIFGRGDKGWTGTSSSLLMK